MIALRAGRFQRGDRISSILDLPLANFALVTFPFIQQLIERIPGKSVAVLANVAQ